MIGLQNAGKTSLLRVLAVSSLFTYLLILIEALTLANTNHHGDV
jgi:hypothetical protein